MPKDYIVVVPSQAFTRKSLTVKRAIANNEEFRVNLRTRELTIAPAPVLVKFFIRINGGETQKLPNSASITNGLLKALYNSPVAIQKVLIFNSTNLASIESCYSKFTNEFAAKIERYYALVYRRNMQ